MTGKLERMTLWLYGLLRTRSMRGARLTIDAYLAAVEAIEEAEKRNEAYQVRHAHPFDVN